MKKIKISLHMILIVLVTIILVACGPELPDVSSNESIGAEESTTPDGEDGENLIIGVSNTIDSMDPFFRSGMASTYVQRYFYESLLDMVGSTEFEPRLGDVTTENNQEYTITIHPEATWTDGTPVTAHDVAFTLDMIADPEVVSSVSGKITMIEGTDEAGKRVEDQESLSGLEVIDDHTLTLTTKEPVDANYVKEYIGFEVLIAPKHIFEDVPKADIQTSEPATKPQVTNGAYQFVENKEGDYVHITANPDYYRGAPKIQNIYFQIVEGVAMVTELQAGNIHMTAGAGIGAIPDEDIPLVEEMEHLTVESSVGTGIQYLIINNEASRFEDQRVREAVSYAIDQELTFENLLHGNGELTATPYTSQNAYLNENIKVKPQDLEKAAELLEEANFDFSEPVQMVVPNGNVAREQMADLTQQWLESVGMTVEQSRYDFTTFLSIMREGNYDIGFSGLTQTYDPDIQTTAGTGGASNYANISDEKLDRLLEEGRQAVTYETRKPIYDEIQEYYDEMVFQIPLYSEAEYIVKDKNLVGGTESFYNATTADIHEWYFE